MSQRSISRESQSLMSSIGFSSASNIRNLASVQNPRTQGLLGKRRATSQPQLPTVKDFVRFITKADQDFGMKEYTMAKCNASIERPVKWSFPKEINKKFINLIEKRAGFGPSPQKYNLQPKWEKTILGSMKGEERKTFITHIFKAEANKPSPVTYEIDNIEKKKIKNLGKILKGERMDTTCDAEYLSSTTPSAIYLDIYTKLPRSKGAPDLKSGLNWRVKKKDGPDPQSYPNKEKAFATLVTKLSPTFKNGKSEREFFTKTISKRKEWVPGAGKYDTIDYSKIHRRLSTKRH